MFKKTSKYINSYHNNQNKKWIILFYKPKKKLYFIYQKHGLFLSDFKIYNILYYNIDKLYMMFNFNSNEFRIPFNVLKATKRLINIIDNKNFSKESKLVQNIKQKIIWKYEIF